jgi:pimeloyl-ACP methyl ester carboxylesterase/DNA-binding CsgD family transcriptional regulator
MFLAMDDFIEATLPDVETERQLMPLDPTFTTHFDRAALVFDVLSRERPQTPLGFVEARQSPTAIVTRGGRLVASNTRFGQALGPQAADVKTLMGLFATPADATRFEGLGRANSSTAQAIVNITAPGGTRPISLLVAQVDDLVAMPENGPALSLMMIQPQWSDETADLLQQAFKLTTAEIDILQSFIASGSVKGIAAARKRSIRTVRTQLSRIFAQMGVSSQTELALFLATLGNVQTEPAVDTQQRPDFDTRAENFGAHVLQIDGYSTEVLDYGDPDGQPLLLLQSTHPPALTGPIRAALRAAGLRIIAPLKPQSGKSDMIPGRPGPEEMAPRFAAVLDQLGVTAAVVAGQASGGLYALTFAQQFTSRCKGVCLIDTGVPFSGKGDLMRLPKSIRRTMVPARYFPEILYLPHRLVAANFARSRRSEASVVDYFFSGSAVDQALTRTDQASYAVTRAIIAYSFDDIDRLVQDVSRWAGDWQMTLDCVAAKLPVSFVHGGENTMFRTGPIESFIAQHPTCRLCVIPGKGQLAVFQDPSTLVKALGHFYSAQ